MQAYLPPSLINFQANYMAFSTWVDHLPFGYDLVCSLRPEITVELGTQWGLSFFCFCQAIKEQEINGKCYAIDTWQGDEHTGEYDNEIYTQVKQHSDDFYPEIANLKRMLFQEAVNDFADESIDLLHIDGLHTYDAVKEDYETWHSKVRPGGIIIFHDIQARMLDFGAWQFWQEISQQTESFTFNQGFGLGVIRKNGSDRPYTPLEKLLFNPSKSSQSQLRQFYAHAAKHQEQLRKTNKKHNRKI